MLTALPDFSSDAGSPQPIKARSSVLKAFLHRPLQTGAVVESGEKLSKKLAEMAHVDEADVVVELGSGTGAVTRHIMNIAPERAHVICLELDSYLARETKVKCPDATVFNSDALLLRSIFDELKINSCDSVVSCIPWANFNADLQVSILDSIDTVLRPGGVFTTFAYLHGLCLPKARKFYKALSQRYNTIESSEIVWANLPPALVYKVVKSQ